MHINLIRFLGVMFCIVNAQFSIGQDLLNQRNSIEYCGYLINKHDFEAANKELNRIEQVFGKSDTINYLYLINASNQKNNKLLFNQIRNRVLKPGTPDYLCLFAIKICFNKDSIVLVNQLTETSSLSETTKLIIKTYVSLYNFDSLKTRALLGITPDVYSTCESTESLLTKIQSIKYKSEINGVLLSSLTPGLGKAYANQTRNGFLTFFTNGLFALQAYRGFSQKGVSSIYGWVFLAASTTFYFGNLYGSYTSVTRYNTHTINSIRDEIKASFNCNIN